MKTLVAIVILAALLAARVDAQVRPPKPGGVTVDCSITACLVKWEDPWAAYRNHKRAHVYRSTSKDFSQASFVGYSDHVGYYDESLALSTEYSYWVAFENQQGVTGAFSDSASDSTAFDVSAGLDRLQDVVQDSDLFRDLGGQVTTPSYVNEELGRIHEELGRIQETVDDILQAIEHDPPDVPVDEYRCGTERVQALALTTARGQLNTSAPAMWDHMPFLVDVSRSFPNPEQLLDAVARETDRINEVLGYDIFLPGQVKVMPDYERQSLEDVEVGLRLMPPAGRIGIHCCAELGAAFPWFRLVLLSADEDGLLARVALIHELYHLLGFSHPDRRVGVPMSPALNRPGRSLFTRSQPLDLARLACIYD